MVSLKQRQSGFTIVELLIVIVIIGILATLVIVTFSGVQQKARDSERKTDINAIANTLETGYANNGSYPTLAGLNSDAQRTTLELKLDERALADPSNAGSEVLVGAPAADNYAYVPSGCTGSTATDTCTGYVLTATLENQSNGATFVRESN